jgi:CO/xanthine dehydrogenase FAD-binding subunit
MRLHKSEAVLQGADRFDDALGDAVLAATDRLDPSGGFHADAQYKLEVIGPLVRRALQQARASYAAKSGALT